MDAIALRWMLAAADTSGGLDIGQVFSFAQFGIVGVAVIMLITKRWIVPKWALDELKETHARELAVKDEIIASKDADIRELKLNVSELQGLTGEKLIPALVQSNNLAAAHVAELSRRGGSSGIIP